MDGNDVFTVEQVAAIKKLIRENPLSLETKDQLPVGVMSYAFDFSNSIAYVAGSSLPVSTTFDVIHGKRLFMFHSGSGYHAAGGAVIGADASVDGNLISRIKIFANPANTHMAFIPAFTEILNLSPGRHTLALALMSGTVSDGNDYHQVVIFETP